MVIIELEGEPHGKERPRFGRHGQIYTPTATKSYEEYLGWASKWAMGGKKPLEGPIKVTVWAFMSIPKSWSKVDYRAAVIGRIWPTVKPDADNILKSLDALNGIVWRDDAQVVDARIIKEYAANPLLRIQVESLRP